MSTRGYDPKDLRIELAGTGFVVGQSRVGSVPVGPESSERIDAGDQLTRLSLEWPASVEAGLFVTPDTPTLSGNARFETTPQVFRDQTILVIHRMMGVVFRGRVRKAQRSVRIDTKQRDSKRWTVSVSASPADSKHAGYNVTNPTSYDEADPATAILERLPYVRNVVDNVGVSAFRVAAGHDETLNAADFLDRISRMTSTYIHSDPDDESTVIIDPYDYGPTWTLSDSSRPSMSGVSFTEDTALATEVKLSVVQVPDADNGGPAEGEDAYTLTKTVSGAERNDQAVGLDVPYAEAAAQLAMAAARMPVVKAPQPEYVSQVVVPYQDGLDYTQRPTRVVVYLGGRRYESAVIGVVMDIETAEPGEGGKWTTTLTCAPIALLDRESA